MILCYLIGSIPFSYLFSRLRGIDIRTRGSGNVGATNVFRTLGPSMAAVALLGDVLKGIAAAGIGTAAGGGWILTACGLAAVIGHCYPVFLRFKGGKGVATSAGIVLYLFTNQLLILLAIFLLMVFAFRFVSLASVTVAVALPVLTLLMGYSPPLMVLTFLMAVLVVYRHKDNIRRLRAGTEPKLGERA